MLQTPVIVDVNNLSSFDLLTTNEVVHESEVMYERRLTSILTLHPVSAKAFSRCIQCKEITILLLKSGNVNIMYNAASRL